MRDTNILSELRRPKPEHKRLWRSLPVVRPISFYVSAVTLAEPVDYKVNYALSMCYVSDGG